ncbi:glycylpeptide N-tetradecanoyltransferase, partial [Coemansia sp. RSA 1937]
MSDKDIEAKQDASQAELLSTEKLHELLRKLDMDGPEMTKLEREAEAERSAVHEFWSTQPVPQTADTVSREGEVHAPLAPEQIRTEPYALPSETMEWCVVDVCDAQQMRELYVLLTENY